MAEFLCSWLLLEISLVAHLEAEYWKEEAYLEEVLEDVVEGSLVASKVVAAAVYDDFGWLVEVEEVFFLEVVQ